MELLALISYGVINLLMILSCLQKQGDYNQFPFWGGVIALGWFFPQLVGGYLQAEHFPAGAYSAAVFFAALCTAAMWYGYIRAAGAPTQKPSWLDMQFEVKKLYISGAALCAFGFFFQWKVWSMPQEVLSETQWSGAVVKYLFLASVFKFGFIALWLLYLSQPKLFVPKLLLFIIPALGCLLYAALILGRRAGMMNLVAYLVVSFWFVRRRAMPRGVLIAGSVFGLILVNSIGTYRSIMVNQEAPLAERVSEAASADYASSSMRALDESGAEFKNYLYARQVHAERGVYDFGSIHWNKLVFNYVPGQIIGSDLKKALQFPNPLNWRTAALEDYGHRYATGTTATGYADAFASFGWFGFIKFLAIGLIMGVLYRRAMTGSFLAQLLYVYTLGTAMHAVSHGTNRILLSSWVYFFMLAFPVFCYAKVQRAPQTAADA